MTKNGLTNQIRRHRFNHDEMTQQQLADEVGVTRQTIIAMEADKYAPSLPLAFRVARTFDLTVEDVFTYCDEQPAQ
ncbi:MAG: helix-turn-helix transcriptional regulator [Planctomycetes bacterium]|nr:helix-turn-helix transcriptional regulator [Planctomycetota bacterium]